jgi:hypothetical protein
MKLISPRAVLEEIVAAIPAECLEHVVIIGSLGVGYHFFGSNSALMVRTKDADCLLSPRVNAIPAGVAITERLIEAQWHFRKDEKWSQPGDKDTPTEDLPAVRLHPPGKSDWFLELLTVPESPDDLGRRFVRMETSSGHFGLCSFGFLALVNYRPIQTPQKVYVAQSKMMALANLLEHPQIGTETMTGLIGDRKIKRSNKDLGRVLAIARLSIREDEDALQTWVPDWHHALQDCFPDRWQEFAARCGAGLRELLDNPNDLEEARHTCEYGLLASYPTNSEQLRIVGARLIEDAVKPLGELARRGK